MSPHINMFTTNTPYRNSEQLESISNVDWDYLRGFKWAGSTYTTHLIPFGGPWNWNFPAAKWDGFSGGYPADATGGHTTAQLPFTPVILSGGTGVKQTYTINFTPGNKTPPQMDV